MNGFISTVQSKGATTRRTIAMIIFGLVCSVGSYQYAWHKDQIDAIGDGNPLTSLAFLALAVVGVAIIAASLIKVRSGNANKSTAWTVAGMVFVALASIMGRDVMSNIGWRSLLVMFGVIAFLALAWIFSTWEKFTHSTWLTKPAKIVIGLIKSIFRTWQVRRNRKKAEKLRNRQDSTDSTNPLSDLGFNES